MIDSNLQAQLRKRFNPDGSDLRKMQLRMLDMLKYLDKICRENDIKYWLSSGTCLGAVRHGGFIPWDDDCDIEMFKSDYLKLEKYLLNNEDSQFKLQCYKTDSEYVLPFSKLRDTKSEIKEPYSIDNWLKLKGCYIDIFVMEPSNSLLISNLTASYWWHTVSILTKIKNNKVRKVAIKTLYPLGKGIMNLLSYIRRIGNPKIYRHQNGVDFPKIRRFEDIQDVTYHTFENTQLPIPKEYDAYLRSLYGDYSIIPNIEEIHSHTTKIIVY